MPNTSKPQTHAAIGLRYKEDAGDHAPTVIAKGFGEIAEEILSLAEQHNVMIHQDEGLVALLSQLDLGQEIPDTLYHVMAELIAFSYVLQGKFPDSWENPQQKISIKE